ncbi:MAG: hypothetical protein JST68_20350 [Bacteroidetes bacterium]|nr:hypothetical protein [Bacteroidota bacterium]
MTTEQHIKAILKPFTSRSQKIDLYSHLIDDSASRLFRVTFTDGRKYSLTAYSKHIEIACKIDSVPYFYINRKDPFDSSNKRLPAGDFPYPVYYRSKNKEIVMKCMEKIKKPMARLALQKGEGVFLFKGAVELVLNPERSILPELAIASSLAQILERHFPQRQEEIDASKIPARLQPLVPFLGEWAISDDQEREEKVGAATKAQLKKLVATVNPLFGEINAWLDSFKKKSMTNEATLVGNLAELVAELKVR